MDNRNQHDKSKLGLKVLGLIVSISIMFLGTQIEPCAVTRFSDITFECHMRGAGIVLGLFSACWFLATILIHFGIDPFE